MTYEIVPEESKPSRRSFLAAVLAAASMAALAGRPSEAEAQERQFTSMHHEPRVSRPRRGHRHRRVARVRKTGRARPHEMQ
ncbi:twin-arginine translocation signal domain-containing protein [Methylocystis bryophila]|uniref:Twin-arginine translocation pathway signal protein n=1 Tax=Methylocystis bryophila TaxID=655015 RepID=A0A1W6MSM3_9HYPH|nr:twin-arginine translocation signal domain-containing protein [Methylocystis bryophila]ARN80611.1 hypothetical protein B1812_05475 [Methylocystis bryophila]BDV40667.1 hypothetical protein DSM21852_39200 [Methylocystis bryophila]